MYLHPAPLASMSGDLVSGTIKLEDYINTVCDRLEEYDPKIESFLPEKGRRERLLREAAALEINYPEIKNRPPLYGVLIGVKDVFRVDGFPTRANSRLDPAVLTGPEADCVRLLKQSGALVLGKTVTTEFAYFEPGPTRNPHNINHTPGGSSSGSAAAVAAGFSPLTLGTQTIGSVNRPAAFCGVVGFKPSYNRIPTGGLLYFSRSADHVGCFTQDLEGMILAAKVLCHDWQDISVNYKPVLGVPKGRYLEQAQPAALELFFKQIDKLKNIGYQINEISALDDIETITIRHRKLIAAEMALEHADLFARFADLYKPRTRELIKEGQGISKHELEEGRRRQKELRDELETLMREAGIDLWITPAATGPSPEGLESTGNPAMSMPWTNAGLPSVSVPAGRFANGLPAGLQLIAPFMGDELLLSWASGLADIFHEFQAYNL